MAVSCVAALVAVLKAVLTGDEEELEGVLSAYDQKVQNHQRQFSREAVKNCWNGSYRREQYTPGSKTSQRKTARRRVPTKLEKRQEAFAKFRVQTNLDTKVRARRDGGGFRRPGSNK